ncbi:MAG: hypothetical protein AB7G13_36285, partial [Lautropia sp.]
ERIHRSNLVALGVLPLEFMPGTTRRTLGLVGDELFDLNADGDGDLRAIRPGSTATLTVHRADGSAARVPLRIRVDTPRESAWYARSGVMPYVLSKLLNDAPAPASMAEQA